MRVPDELFREVYGAARRGPADDGLAQRMVDRAMELTVFLRLAVQAEDVEARERWAVRCRESLRGLQCCVLLARDRGWLESTALLDLIVEEVEALLAEVLSN